MSLLHKVRNFSITLVFVFSLSIVGTFMLTNKVSAGVKHIYPSAERFAMAKALYGLLFHCLGGNSFVEVDTGYSPFTSGNCLVDDDEFYDNVAGWFIYEITGEKSFITDGGDDEDLTQNKTSLVNYIFESFSKLGDTKQLNLKNIRGENSKTITAKGGVFEVSKDTVCNEGGKLYVDNCIYVFADITDLVEHPDKMQEYARKYANGDLNAQDAYIKEIRPYMPGMAKLIEDRFNTSEHAAIHWYLPQQGLKLHTSYTEAEKYWIYWHGKDWSVSGGLTDVNHAGQDGWLSINGLAFDKDGYVDPNNVQTYYFPSGAKGNWLGSDWNIYWYYCSATSGCGYLDVDPYEGDSGWVNGYSTDMYTAAQNSAIEDFKWLDTAKHSELFETLKLNEAKKEELFQQHIQTEIDTCIKTYERNYNAIVNDLISQGLLAAIDFDTGKDGHSNGKTYENFRKLYDYVSPTHVKQLLYYDPNNNVNEQWGTRKKQIGNTESSPRLVDRDVPNVNPTLTIKPLDQYYKTDKVGVYNVYSADLENYQILTTGTEKRTLIHCYSNVLSDYVKNTYVPNELGGQVSTELEQYDTEYYVNGTDGKIDQPTEITGPTISPEPVDVTIPQGTEDYEADVCYSSSDTLGWILCPAITAASGIGEHLWTTIERDHLKLPSNAIFGVVKGSGANAKPGVRMAWEAFRDIANIVFVIVFLIIVVSQVTGYGINNYGIKRMLPKLIAAILLVNLSYVICQLIVDLSNAIGVSISNLFDNIAAGIKGQSLTFANPYIDGEMSAIAEGGSWIFLLLIAGGGAVLFALLKGSWGALISGIILFALGLIIVIVVAMLTLYITLVIREAAIITCIAIAPLAIICNILPNTEPLFKKWLNLMKALLVLYPLCGFVIGASKVAGIVLASTGIDSMRTAAGVVQVVPYFFIPSLLRKSLAGLGNIGGRLSTLGRSMSRRASSGMKGAVRNSNWHRNAMAKSEYNMRKRRQRRLENRRDADPSKFSDRRALRLKALQDANQEYENKLASAQTETQAGRYEARKLEAEQNVKDKDTKLMTGFGGATFNEDGSINYGTKQSREQNAAEYAKAHSNMVLAQAEDARNKAMNYASESAVQGMRIQNAENNEKLRNDMEYIAQNADVYKDANKRKADTERKAEMEKLATTWGGAQYDMKGNLIVNVDGSIKYDSKRADEYAAGVLSNRAIAAHKDAEDNIEQARHAQSMFEANTIKGAIDRTNQTRAIESLVRDLDENGNVTNDPSKVKYRAADARKNYEQGQLNKANRGIASNLAAPAKLNMESAVEQFQASADAENLKNYTSQAAAMDGVSLNATADNLIKNFNSARTQEAGGHPLRLAASISSLYKKEGQQKAAYARFDQAIEEYNRQIEAADSAQNTELASSLRKELNAFQSNVDISDDGFKAWKKTVGGKLTDTSTGRVATIAQVLSSGEGEKDAEGNPKPSIADLASKKNNGVIDMSSDTLSYASASIKSKYAATGQFQTALSGKEIQHLLHTNTDPESQNSLRDIIDATDLAAQFKDVRPSAASVTTSDANFKLELDIAQKSAEYKQALIEEMAHATPETITKLGAAKFKERQQMINNL